MAIDLVVVKSISHFVIECPDCGEVTIEYKGKMPTDTIVCPKCKNKHFIDSIIWD